jgi:hypothetical protein
MKGGYYVESGFEDATPCFKMVDRTPPALRIHPRKTESVVMHLLKRRVTIGLASEVMTRWILLSRGSLF